MTNAKRIHVYLTQRYGPNFPRSYAQDAFAYGGRLTAAQRRRAARKGFREEVQAA